MSDWALSAMCTILYSTSHQSNFITPISLIYPLNASPGGDRANTVMPQTLTRSIGHAGAYLCLQSALTEVDPANYTVMVRQSPNQTRIRSPSVPSCTAVSIFQDSRTHL